MRLLLPLVASSVLFAAPAGAFTILLDNLSTGPVSISLPVNTVQTNSSRGGQTFFSPLDPSGGAFNVGAMDIEVNTNAASTLGLGFNLSGGSIGASGSAGGVGSFFGLAYGSFTSTFTEPGVLVIPIGSAAGTWNLFVDINGNSTSYVVSGPGGSELRLLTGAVSSITDITLIATLLAADPNTGSAAININPITIVPEPSRALLLLGGLAPLALRRRRRC